MTQSEGIGTGITFLLSAGLFFGLSTWIKYQVGADWEEVAILLLFGFGFLVAGVFFLIDAGVDTSYFRKKAFFLHAARASAMAPLLALFAAVMVAVGLSSDSPSAHTVRPLAAREILAIVRIVVTILCSLGLALGAVALAGIPRHGRDRILPRARTGLAVSSAILALMFISWLF